MKSLVQRGVTATMVLAGIAIAANTAVAEQQPTAEILEEVVGDSLAEFDVDTAGEQPKLLLSIPEHEKTDWSGELCEAFSDAFPTTCVTDAGVDDGTFDALQDTGLFRYHAQLDLDGDGLALRVDDWSSRRRTPRLVDHRWSDLELASPNDSAELTLDALEHNVIAGAPGVHTTVRSTPSYARASAWLAASLAAATWWYFAAGDLNSKDWDYSGLFADDSEFDFRPQSEVWRNFGGWRFDDNVMFLNTPLHAMAGGGYYLLGRASNLGMWGSILAANIASFFWEAGIEHHEVISLNDLVLTNVGGIPLGEAYHQLGRFFRSAEPTPFNRTMSWIFATPTELHDLLDGTGPLYLGSRGDFGWPESTWHRFRLDAAGGAADVRGVDTARWDGGIAGEAELVRLPDFQRPGDHDRWLAGPLRTQLTADLFTDGNRVSSWHLQGDLTFGGYYRHRVGGDDNAIGTSQFAGSGLGFRHIQHRYGEVLDRYGIVHLPGAVFDLSWLTGPVDVRLRYGVHPDFTTIDSHALRVYRGESLRSPNRTVLDQEDYYYGWGVSSLLALHLNADPVHLEWNWNAHWTRSIDTRDRFWDDEERFGRDLDQYLALTDAVSHHELGAFVDTPISNLQTGLVGEVRTRSGTIENGDETWRDDDRELRGMGVVRMAY